MVTVSMCSCECEGLWSCSSLLAFPGRVCHHLVPGLVIRLVCHGSPPKPQCHVHLMEYLAMWILVIFRVLLYPCSKLSSTMPVKCVVGIHAVCVLWWYTLLVIFRVVPYHSPTYLTCWMRWGKCLKFFFFSSIDRIPSRKKLKFLGSEWWQGALIIACFVGVCVHVSGCLSKAKSSKLHYKWLWRSQRVIFKLSERHALDTKEL